MKFNDEDLGEIILLVVVIIAVILVAGCGYLRSSKVSLDEPRPAQIEQVGDLWDYQIEIERGTFKTKMTLEQLYKMMEARRK
jgi:hypothetical protein